MTQASLQIAHVSSFASHAASSLWTGVSAFLAFFIIAGIFFLSSRYLGKGPFVALIMALYAGYAIYATFPYWSLLPSASPVSTLIVRAAVYAALVFAFFLVLKRMVVSDFLHISLVGLLILSFSASAFILALGFHTLNFTSIHQFSPAIQNLFGRSSYFFWWFSVPAAALFVLIK